ncbi:MAG: aldehyde dehydrogenase (NADP(+)) [Ferruginibacter sp.]
MISGKNLIGYTVSGEGTYTFTSSIPGEDKPSDQLFLEASPAEIDLAVTKAHQAFSTFRLSTADQKITFLEHIATEIAAAKEELLTMAMFETHLPKPRLEGEVQRTVNQIKLFVNLLKEGSWVKAIIDTALPERTPLPRPDIRQMQIPLGPVAVFGASNFPFAFSVAGGDTISALAAGCPVVYKSHPGHPATSELVGKIIVEAAKEYHLPDGVFSLLQGKSNECSISLVTHPLIKAVGFTGSFTGGKALYDAAAKRTEPIPVYAEMGSVNPVFILPEIMQQQAPALADKLSGSNLLSAGQFCTNPGIIISLQSAGTDSFLSAFAGSVQNAAANSMLTDNICNNYNAGIKKLINSGDAVLQSAGKETVAGSATPHMFQTSATSFLANKELWHEVFGPSSIHVVAASEEELYAIAKELTGQLTVSIWGTEVDLSAFAGLATELELKAGRIIFNNVPTGVEVTHAMVHGGPFPATTNSMTTSVGSNAIYRFTRAVCYQNSPQQLLPGALKNENPFHIWRQVDGVLSNKEIL